VASPAVADRRPPHTAAPCRLVIKYLGYLAGLLTVLSFLPQVLRAWRTRQTRDLSLRTFVLLVAAGACWVTYGVLERDWPVITTNVGMLVLNISLLVAKLRYK
jgi:MtN3 and saliva related transmembrane protein